MAIFELFEIHLPLLRKRLLLLGQVMNLSMRHPNLTLFKASKKAPKWSEMALTIITNLLMPKFFSRFIGRVLQIFLSDLKLKF